MRFAIIGNVKRSSFDIALKQANELKRMDHDTLNYDEEEDVDYEDDYDEEEDKDDDEEEDDKDETEGE